MPLTGYHLIGFDKDPISFTHSDFRLLQNPEHRERAESFFSRTPHRFNLIFHNPRPPITDFDLKRYRYNLDQIDWFLIMFGRVGGNNRWKLQWSSGQQKNIFLRGNTALLDPDAINFIYMSNVTGTPVIPLTPHMMAHRMGHMHILNQENQRFLEFLERWGNLVLTNYYDYNILADECRSILSLADFRNRVYGWGENPHRDALWWNAIFKYITTTRAGRKRQVTGWEYIPEWFAQYVNLGRLNLVPELPEDLVLEDIYRNDKALQIPIPIGTLSSPHCERYPTDPFAHRIEQFFEHILRSWKGQLIVT